MDATQSASRRPNLSAARFATAAVTVGVALSALSGGIAHAAPATPLPGFWMPNGNDSLLLNADTAGRLTGLSGLAVSGVSSQFADSSKRVSPVACVALYQPAEATAYPSADNVTTVALADQRDGEADHLVQQSVIGYADSSSARAEYASVAAAWSQCSGAGLTVKSRAGTTKNWTVGLPMPARADGILVVSNLGPGGVCERAVTQRDAIIVDVMACDFGAGTAAGQAAAVAARVGNNVAERDG